MTKKRKTTSTELTVVDSNRLALLREKAGISESSGSVWPKALAVSRTPLTDDDKPLPMGKFTIEVDGKRVYLENPDLIIITKGTQFRRWKKDKTYVGSTMIENPGKAEFLDSVGTVKLGKFVGEDLTDSQKAFNSEIKFYFFTLGLVDIQSAVDAQGVKLFTDKTSVWHPMKLEFNSKKAVEKQNELNKLKKRNEANFDFITRPTKPHKVTNDAGVVWYEYNFERGDDVVFTEELLQSIEAAQSLIENENKRIYKMHLDAQSKSNVNEEEDLTSLDLNDE